MNQSRLSNGTDAVDKPVAALRRRRRAWILAAVVCGALLLIGVGSQHAQKRKFALGRVTASKFAFGASKIEAAERQHAVGHSESNGITQSKDGDTGSQFVAENSIGSPTRGESAAVKAGLSRLGHSTVTGQFIFTGTPDTDSKHISSEMRLASPPEAGAKLDKNPGLGQDLSVTGQALKPEQSSTSQLLNSTEATEGNQISTSEPSRSGLQSNISLSTVEGETILLSLSPEQSEVVKQFQSTSNFSANSGWKNPNKSSPAKSPSAKEILLRIKTKQILRFRKTNCGCRRILLVIIFNRDHYDNVPFLHALYGSVFCSIVHYGPKADELFEVHKMEDNTHGFLQQLTLAQAWRDFPDFEGYLWAGDDVLLNPQLMFGSKQSLSVSNIWLQHYEKGQKVNISNIPQTWSWKHPFNSTSTSDDLVREWRDKVPERFKENQRLVMGCDCMMGVGSDMGYLPGEFMEDFANFTELLPGLNFEIFIPTVARVLTNDTLRIQELQGLYLWAQHDRAAWVRRFDTAFHMFVHPVKFSSDANRHSSIKLHNVSWTPVAGTC